MKIYPFYKLCSITNFSFKNVIIVNFSTFALLMMIVNKTCKSIGDFKPSKTTSLEGKVVTEYYLC